MIPGAGGAILPAVMNKKLHDRYLHLLGRASALLEDVDVLIADVELYMAVNRARSQTIRRVYASRHAAELKAALGLLADRLSGGARE